MASKVGPYGKANLGKSSSPISGSSRPSYVSASSSSGKGVGPYSRSNLGTPGGQKPGAHVAPSSSGGKGVGDFGKSTLGSFSTPRFKSPIGDGSD
jgi:hypothetical protein